MHAYGFVTIYALYDEYKMFYLFYQNTKVLFLTHKNLDFHVGGSWVIFHYCSKSGCLLL